MKHTRTRRRNVRVAVPLDEDVTLSQLSAVLPTFSSLHYGYFTTQELLGDYTTT